MSVSLIYFLLTFVISVSIGIGGLLLVDHSRRLRRARLVRYSADHPGKTSDRVMRRLAASESKERLGLRQDKKGLAGLLEVRLREAGLAISPGAAIGLMIVAAVLIFCALWFLALLFWPIAIVASIAGAWVAFNAGLGALRARRVRTFNDALPDCLDVFARGLRAGQPIAAALTVVSQHARGIAQEEFKRCCEEMKLGVPLIAALNGIAERIGTPEAHFVTVATSLQAETGGNLVETLENLAALLRDRHKLRKKATALTAEIRVSAVILSSLPFVIAVTLYIMNPGYLTPLIMDSRGQMMAAIGVASLGMGIYSMFKLARIDV